MKGSNISCDHKSVYPFKKQNYTHTKYKNLSSNFAALIQISYSNYVYNDSLTFTRIHTNIFKEKSLDVFNGFIIIIMNTARACLQFTLTNTLYILEITKQNQIKSQYLRCTHTYIHKLSF